MNAKQLNPTMSYLSSLLMICIAFLLLVISACSYDSEEALYGPATCDTTSVSYSQRVVPILNARCNACHGGSFPQAGIDLTSHANVLNFAETGLLVGVIDHTIGSPMPKNQPIMPACERAAIRNWVAQGALNN